MSFDAFFLSLRDDDAGVGGREAMLAVLEPFVRRRAPEYDFLFVEYGDGEADIYLGDGNSMMANRITGEALWDLLVKGARAADWVILPVGCPTCLTDEAQRARLPQELADDVVLVPTGADLLAAMASA